MNEGGRITGEDTSYLSVCLGLAAVIIIGSIVYYVSTYKSEHKKTDPYNFSKPVPSDAELRLKLKEDSYRVVRENATEPAFQNEYWNNEKPGIYVDVVTGDPLFTSLDKFNAGNGRPNFSKPLDPSRITTKPDISQGLQRTDVRAVRSNAHLGWLFKDGPPPSGDRYMLNSAALKFIPVDKMETEGYAQWLNLFPNATPAPTAGK